MPGTDPELYDASVYAGSSTDPGFSDIDNLYYDGKSQLDTAPSSVLNYTGKGRQVGFNVRHLFSVVNEATISAKLKILEIRSRRSAISIGDMFEMQMLMNHLSQLSEMSTSVVSAAHSAISSMARNVKG